MKTLQMTVSNSVLMMMHHSPKVSCIIYSGCHVFTYNISNQIKAVCSLSWVFFTLTVSITHSHKHTYITVGYRTNWSANQIHQLLPVSPLHSWPPQGVYDMGWTGGLKCHIH